MSRADYVSTQPYRVHSLDNAKTGEYRRYMGAAEAEGREEGREGSEASRRRRLQASLASLLPSRAARLLNQKCKGSGRAPSRDQTKQHMYDVSAHA